MPPLSRLVLVALAPLALTGCGVLLGNVKPLAEKSVDYRVADLAQESPETWERIPSSEINPASAGDSDARESTDATDVAYQSRRNASIISLNSACRERLRNRDHTLQEYTRELLLGITDIQARDEREIQVQGQRALETTLQGRMGAGAQAEPVKLRAVVVRKDDCLYDLMYVARPETFAAHEPDFSRFIESLRLR
jgi:hypothetical protein